LSSPPSTKPGNCGRRLGDAALDVDIEGNTITVGITHASLWAVMDGDTVEQRATVVQALGWGVLKKSMRR
jgi:hypothetical protein